jgi:UDP-N-acetylglucosamine acyltransferase
MAGSHVGHDCIIGSHCVFANYATLGGHVELGDWVHMGGFSGIHQFCKVGPHAFIANNTAVTRDVPPYVMAVGRPAEPHSVNAEGLKRRGFTTDQIRNIREAYRVLYRSGLKLAEALEELESRVDSQPELAAFVGFLNESTPRRERVGIVR